VTAAVYVVVSDFGLNGCFVEGVFTSPPDKAWLYDLETRNGSFTGYSDTEVIVRVPDELPDRK
jgi:hypothetical protein